MNDKQFSLRVLSYNIHKGFSAGKKKFILQGIKEAIRLVRADLVFLQEVIGEHREHQENVEDWPSATQFEFLADSVWDHFAYGKNAVYDAGHHGNAILSKYPIIESSNVDISRRSYEARGVLRACIEIPNRQMQIWCYCTHFGLLSRDRKRQIVKLCQLVKKDTAHSPIIIAGDFNDWTQRVSNRLLKHLNVDEVFYTHYGKHVRTFPSRFPILPLDRIYCRKMEIAEAEVLTGAPWNRLSDHAALYAELTCNGEM